MSCRINGAGTISKMLHMYLTGRYISSLFDFSFYKKNKLVIVEWPAPGHMLIKLNKWLFWLLSFHTIPIGTYEYISNYTRATNLIMLCPCEQNSLLPENTYCIIHLIQVQKKIILHYKISNKKRQFWLENPVTVVYLIIAIITY